MTSNDLKQLVGKIGLLSSGKLSVPVGVLDSRYVFGRTDLLVTPIGGSGQEWVETGRVRLTDGKDSEL
jgi:hypothetical protein